MGGTHLADFSLSSLGVVARDDQMLGVGVGGGRAPGRLGDHAIVEADSSF